MYSHSLLSLQEAIATSLEQGKECIVAFYDVAKASDGVWIDGLFRQVYNSGITGRTWWLLYHGYIDFRCCAKVAGTPFTVVFIKGGSCRY